eukprot:comp21090_c0_seq1/m.28451 comp21090_c0_seq1/g.28451  ORF comp21090_c0_seq1/g.28451 comp21090_c0_seq1/m.28451 type:complete len:445 (-) comp21090_c0_seq1:19-1353(-)
MMRFRALTEALQSGSLTPSQLLERTLQRISKVNPKLNTVVVLDRERAQEAAKKQTKADGGVKGMPILVKEVVDVQGLPTTLACPDLMKMKKDTFRAPRHTDADVVHSLREKGAIILGKTNIPQKGVDIQSSNPVFGTCNNPWDVSRTPGGSSGGSAAAVAAGLVPIAVGSDLGGSLRLPAAFCGVSSLRPTYGRISTIGHVVGAPTGPAAESTLQVGAMTVDCDAQAAFMAAACATFDPSKAQPPNPQDILIHITPAFPGVPTDSRIVHHLTTVLPQILTDAGFKVKVGGVPVLDRKALSKSYTCFAQTMFQDGNGPNDAQMEEAVKQRDLARASINEFLGSDSFWILPVASTLAFTHNPKQEPIKIKGSDKPVSYWAAALPYVTPLTVTSHPVLTLPVGVIDGLPLGVQIVGRSGDDERLIGLGRAIETVIPPVAPPMAWLDA